MLAGATGRRGKRVMTAPGGGASAATARIVPVDRLRFTKFMEQLQEGYVASVAATAGCSVEFIRRDLYTLDAMIIKSLDEERQEISLMAQLKCTSRRKPDPAKGSFSYQFKRAADFKRLAMPRKDPKAILLVMVTRPVQAEWTECNHEMLTVRHCCYWVSLEGRTVRPGVQSPSVPVPTSNIFDSEALTKIMDKLDRGEALS
jgi:hypothetical protein